MATPSYNKLARQKDAALTRIKRLRDENKMSIQRAIDAALIGGSAFSVAYAEARWPNNTEFAGLPLSLVVAGGAMLASVAGVETGGALDAIGMGAWAAYASGKGEALGIEHKAEKS